MKITIVIDNADADDFEIEVYPSSVVKDIKEKIEDTHGIPVAKQMLKNEDAKLEDATLMSAAGIHEGSIIVVCNEATDESPLPLLSVEVAEEIAKPDSPKLNAGTIAMVSNWYIKSNKWKRQAIKDFQLVTLKSFHGHVKCNPELLYPASQKHESWAGSDTPPGPSVPLAIWLATTLILAIPLGLIVGFLVNRGMGLVGGAAVILGMAVVLLVILISYMIAYSNGLKANQMGACVKRLGYPKNVQANVVCRYLMTCFYNPCKVDILNCIMGGEASDAEKRIKAMNGGKGPKKGGVVWLGDSEFTFWHHMSEELASFHPNCINAGFGGSRLTDIMKNIDRLCLSWDPSIVIVHAAGNDFDFNQDLPASAMPERLLPVFERIAAHPSVKHIGYMLSSRRPTYSDTKWEFMYRVHELTIKSIKAHHLGKMIEVLDLRDMMHPLDEFVDPDRSHLNDKGHHRKAQHLLNQIPRKWWKLEV